MNMMCVRGCVLLLLLMLQAVSPALSVVFPARNADDAGARLLPRPRRVEWHSSSLALDRVKLSTNVLLSDWEALIVELGGKVSEHAASAVSVVLVPELEGVPLNKDEAYRLRVDERGIRVEAVTECGVYRAIQTLRQLAEKTTEGTRIPCCEILDWPAFRIRGWMHDTGRSYISMEELKREIAVLSKFKINTFHWHLTENQAWRLESKLFPALNDSANMTRMPGQFYTLEEAKELVRFCKAHHMTLIPEIDMPGHSAAFVRTFGHDMQSPEGMKILKLLIDEVCETFDVPWLHIGTDEVKFTNPRFVPEMVAYVRSKGKKVISWNPGWRYKPGEIDMTQLWSYRGKRNRAFPPSIPAFII